MVLLILPAWSREVPNQIKHFMHAFSILEDACFIVILFVVLYMWNVLIEHTEIFFPPGSDQHKIQVKIQVNAPFLASEFITMAIQAIIIS